MGQPAFKMASAIEAKEMRDALAEQAEREAREANLRSSTRVGMQAAISGSSNDSFFVGFSENLSEGGVFVATFCPPAVGEQVDLSVDLEGSPALLVKGVVRWHRMSESGEPTGCGVQFVGLHPEQEDILNGALERAQKTPLFYDL